MLHLPSHCSEVVERVLAPWRDSWYRRFAEQRRIAVSERVLIAHNLVQAPLADDADPQKRRAHAKHGGQREGRHLHARLMPLILPLMVIESSIVDLYAYRRALLSCAWNAQGNTD